MQILEEKKPKQNPHLLDTNFIAYLHRRLDKEDKPIFYVGIGRPHRAYSKHQRNNHWKSIVAKSGGRFDVEILAVGLDWETAKAVEIGVVDLLGRDDLGTGILCNKTNGGDGVFGMVYTEERNRKVSESLKGVMVGEKNPMFGNKNWLGKKHTPESLLKIGAATKARNYSGTNNPSHKGLIEAFKDGVFIGRYDSTVDAGRQLGMDRRLVTSQLTGKNKTARGYTFKRIPKDEN